MADALINEVAFFGRVTAGFTHEMKNVLAIIRESSGLIEDLMAMSPETSPYQEKYQRALTNIRVQVQRGIDLTTRMNQFAHTPDQAVKQVDLFEITEILIELTQRLARLKNMVITGDSPAPSGRSLLLVTNPVQLLMGLFNALECWFSLALSGSRIHIRPFNRENTPVISITCEGIFSERNELAQRVSETEPWPLLLDTITRLGGRIEIDESTAGILLLLSNLQPAGAASD